MIRRLNGEVDGELYHQMYEWLATSPQWRQDTEAVFGTVDRTEYLKAIHSPGRCDIGIFDDDGGLSAVVILTLTAKNVYEVHFESAPTVHPQLVISAGRLIRARLFDEYGAELVYTWTPRFNRAVLRINQSIGFTPDHVSMFRGTCRGKLIEWVRYSLGRNG